MTDANDRQSEIIATIAFFLMIGGVLVPLLIALLVFLVPGINLSENSARIVGVLAVGFAFLSEVLALVLGIFCWRHLFAKVAMTGAATLLVLAALVCALFICTEVRTTGARPQMAPTETDTGSRVPHTTTTPVTPQHKTP